MKIAYSPTALLSALALGVLAFAGCGGGGSGPGTQPTPTGTANPTGTPTTTPTSSPLSTIVYSSGSDIYAVNSDGTQRRALTRATTTSSPLNRTPWRSRDGQRVVFSSNRDGNFEIYSMGIAGESAGVQRLTNDTGSSQPDDTAPAYSPDGNKIAWVSARGGASNVWIMDSTGANQTQLTTEGRVTSVAFSPTGTEVAYSVARTSSAVIVAKNISSGNERILVQGSYSATQPHYSPDGTRLSFALSQPGGGITGVGILDLTTRAITTGIGSGSTLLRFFGGGAFSPDGSRIVAPVASLQNSTPMGGAPGIGKADAFAGSTITTLTGLGGAGDYSPSWGQ